MTQQNLRVVYPHVGGKQHRVGGCETGETQGPTDKPSGKSKVLFEVDTMFSIETHIAVEEVIKPWGLVPVRAKNEEDEVDPDFDFDDEEDDDFDDDADEDVEDLDDEDDLDDLDDDLDVDDDEEEL